MVPLLQGSITNAALTFLALCGAPGMPRPAGCQQDMAAQVSPTAEN